MKSKLAPPWPEDPVQRQRWAHTRMRRAMLSGAWHDHVRERIRVHFGHLLGPRLGNPSIARNQFATLCERLAANYVEEPRVRHSTEGELLGFLLPPPGGTSLLQELQLWARAPEFQRLLIGCREMAQAIEIGPSGRPYLRWVEPDYLLAQLDPADAGQLLYWSELHWRDEAWWWEVYDLRGEEPIHLLQPVEPGKPVVVSQGETYPWRWSQGARKGRPFIPRVLYHAALGTEAFAPLSHAEIVEGALDVAVAYTFLQRCLFHSAYPQRWGLDVTVQGAQVISSEIGVRSEVPTAPGALLHLASTEGARQPQVGQWGPGMDPVQIQIAVERLERAIGHFDGLDVSALQQGSANPQSAEALALQQQARREAQRRYRPALQAGDCQLLQQLAAVCNVIGLFDRPLPEQGYRIEYATLPLSPQEQDAEQRRLEFLLAAGLISRRDAWLRLHPGRTQDEADVALAAIGVATPATPARTDQGGQPPRA